MKGKYLMNREIYERIFGIIQTHNDICNKLESAGLRFEYGDGFVGKSLEALLNDSEIIIRESLGLHEVSGLALYTKENDPDWSISLDDFCEFFYKAIENDNIRDLMWKAMVEKNIEAKQQYNQLNFGRIGPYEDGRVNLNFS